MFTSVNKLKHWIGQILKNPLILTLIIYLTAVVIINPFAEFIVDDDWIFFRQVEAFTNGNFQISALIDPTFIFQGLLGFTWTKIFGLSFLNLRILSILVYIFFLTGFYLILKKINISAKALFLILLFTAFNPISFNLSLSFMTDIYYLAFFTWSIYFYTGYIANSKIKYLRLALIMASLSFLCRQYGIILPIAFFGHNLWKYKKVTINYLVQFLFCTVPAIIIYLIWPRYGGGTFLNVFLQLNNFQSFFSNSLDYLLSVPYLIHFCAATILLLKTNLAGKKILFVNLLLILLTAVLIFKVDIFSIGSIFYLEGLHLKSDFRHNFSLIDNVVVKIFLATFIAFYFTKFLNFTKDIKKLSDTQMFLLLTTVLSIAILVTGNDMYDRYLLPTATAFTLFIASFIPKEAKYARWQTFILIILCFLHFFLNLDFFNHTKLRWQQGILLQEEKGVMMQIYVDSFFGRYFTAKKLNNYDGSIYHGTDPNTALCFVQRYTTDAINPPFTAFEPGEKFIEKYIKNPDIPNAKKKSIKRIKSNLESLKYNWEYSSPLYNLVGKRAFVGSWCVEP